MRLIFTRLGAAVMAILDSALIRSVYSGSGLSIILLPELSISLGIHEATRLNGLERAWCGNKHVCGKQFLKKNTIARSNKKNITYV